MQASLRRIRDEFKSYNTHAHSGRWGAAIEVLAYLRAEIEGLAPDQRRRATAELDATNPPFSSWTSAYEVLARDCRKLVLILDAGGQLLYEEVMHVFTMRMSVDVVLNLISRYAPSRARRARRESEIARQVAGIDEQLIQLSRDKKQSQVYRSAISQMRRASGLPTQYLDEFFGRITGRGAAGKSE